MDNYETKDEFMAWCKSKKDEFKDDVILDSYCAAAISENKSNFLEKLLNYKYPENGTGIAVCISGDFSDCLKILLIHVKYKLAKLELLKLTAQKEAAFLCIVVIIEMIKKTNRDTRTTYYVEGIDDEFRAWGKSLAEIKGSNFKNDAYHQAIMIDNHVYVRILSQLDYKVYETCVFLCINGNKYKCLDEILGTLSISQDQYNRFLQKAHRLVSIDCIPVIIKRENKIPPDWK